MSGKATYQALRRNLAHRRLINPGFHFGRLHINRKDAADRTVVAGFVVEVAGYVQRYRRAEIVALDAQPVPAALKTGHLKPPEFVGFRVYYWRFSITAVLVQTCAFVEFYVRLLQNVRVQTCFYFAVGCRYRFLFWVRKSQTAAKLVQQSATSLQYRT